MESRRIRYPLGAVSSIEAETFGEPGMRTFRLVLKAGAAISLVWLEKEQLFQLGTSLQEAVRRLSEADRERPSTPEAPEWSGEETNIEFKALQLMLKYEPSGNSFYFEAHEGDEGEDDAASTSCWVTVSQSAVLSEEALRICAAGRPPCLLCGLPIDPNGHICPRSNGHAVFESG